MVSFTARQAQHQLRISARVKLISTFEQKTLESTKAVSYLDGTPLGLDLGITNLAVVNDNSIPTSAPRGSISPSNALGELGIRVGKEELSMKVSSWSKETKLLALTMESRTPFTLPHALMTKGSLKARTAIISTPFSFSLGRFWMYPGTWLAEQVGVKAPGTEKRTTFLSAHSLEASYLIGIPHEEGSLLSSVHGMYLLTFN